MYIDKYQNIFDAMVMQACYMQQTPAHPPYEKYPDILSIISR